MARPSVSKVNRECAVWFKDVSLYGNIQSSFYLSLNVVLLCLRNLSFGRGRGLVKRRFPFFLRTTRYESLTFSELVALKWRKVEVSLALIYGFEPFSLILDAQELKVDLVSTGTDDSLLVVHCFEIDCRKLKRYLTLFGHLTILLLIVQ